MRSSWDFLLNMLEKLMMILTCKQSWSAYHFIYFQNSQILRSRNRTNPLTAQLRKLTLPPGKEVGSIFFLRQNDGKG